MVKPRTAIRLLTKVTYMDCSTLFFRTRGLGRRSGNSRDTFIKPEHVPDFEGHEAWFELEHVTAKPWSYWRAIRQAPPPPDWAAHSAAPEAEPHRAPGAPLMVCFPDTLDKVMASESATLKIEWGCGHREAFARQEAFRRFGERADPMLIRQLATCKCGARRPGRVWV